MSQSNYSILVRAFLDVVPNGTPAVNTVFGSHVISSELSALMADGRYDYIVTQHGDFYRVYNRSEGQWQSAMGENPVDALTKIFREPFLHWVPFVPTIGYHPAGSKPAMISTLY